MSVRTRLPVGTTERFPRIGSRRWVAAGLLLLGGIATLLGLFLPWGRNVNMTLTGLSPSMAVFSLALGVVGILAVLCGGFTLSDSVVSAWTKAGSLSGALLGTAVWLFLPVGMDIVLQYQPGGAIPTLEIGAWILAVGVTAVITGSMLVCTRRRTSTLVALLFPVIAALLMLIELQ